MLLKSLSIYEKKYNVFNKKAIFEAQKMILFSILAIFAVSILCLYSAAGGVCSDFVLKQIFFITISLGVFFTIISVNIKIIYKVSYVSLLIAIGLLTVVIPFGKRVLGASRWLDFGFVMVQPSEFAKIAVILVLARFFSRINVKQISRFYTTIFAFLLISPVFVLVVIQPDLATSLIILFIVSIMLFTVGIPKWEFISAFVLMVLSLPIIWVKCLKEYQKLRVINFLNPENDPFGSGYNIIQSKIAIGSGGVFGKGYFQGVQGRLRFLPEHHTDFIFTNVCEEFGFIGALIVISLYLLITMYGFRVASQTNSVFCKLIAIGCSSLIFLHMFINIGMTSGLLPVAGIPLVMISYGGSSLLLGVICIALIVNVDINNNIL